MKNNAIFARKCEINYQMWIKKCKSGKVSYSLLSYKWRNFQLVNFITICCTTLPRIASHTAHFVCLLSNRGPQNKPGASFHTPHRVPKNKPRLCLFVMGNSGGTSCPIPIGYPKGNQDIVCLQKNGVSKVNQDLSVCFGEKGERRHKSPKSGYLK